MKSITVALVTDKNGGFGFNFRRQSRDRELVRDLCTLADADIVIREYSEPLFSEFPDRIKLCSSPLSELKECVFFCEGEKLEAIADKIQTVILYEWDKVYPADIFSDIFDILGDAEPVSDVYFTGYSHEAIRRRIYKL